MFKPLGIFIAVVLGVTFLADTLYLGRYIILWISVLTVHGLEIKNDRILGINLDNELNISV